MSVLQSSSSVGSCDGIEYLSDSAVLIDAEKSAVISQNIKNTEGDNQIWSMNPMMSSDDRPANVAMTVFLSSVSS